MATYRNYRNLKDNSKRIIACPECSETMTPRQYAVHRRAKHDSGFNEKTQCPFCPSYIWNNRQKNKHGDHLYRCLKNFIKIHKPLDPVFEDVPEIQGYSCIRCAAFVGDHRWVGENERLPDVGDFYPTLDSFREVDWLQINDSPTVCGGGGGGGNPPTPNRSLKLFEHREYDLPKILMNPLEFDPSTGLAGVPYWIKVYAQYSSLFDFYHVLIRAGAYKSFQSLVSSSDDVCMLPYTCLCDSHSGKSTDPRYIWHRHILLVTRNDASFQDAFKKIRFEYRLPSSYRKGEKIPIRDMYHWMNALYYVSSAEDQTLKRKRKTVNELECDGGHHVSIAIPMIPHAVAHMSLLVPDMMDYYLQEITKNKSVGCVKSKERFYQQWYAPAPEMTNIVNCPLKFRSPLQRMDTSKLFKTHSKNFFKMVTDRRWTSGGGGSGKVVTPYGFFTRRDTYLVREVGGPPSTLMNLNSDPHLNYFRVGRRLQFMMNEIDRNTKLFTRQIGNLQSQLGFMTEAMGKRDAEIQSIKDSMSQTDRETEKLVDKLMKELNVRNKNTLIQQLSESTSHVDQINILWNRLLEQKEREMSRLLEQKEREMSRLLEQKEREMSKLEGRIRQTERLKMQLQQKDSEILSLTEQVECLKREINQRNDQSKAEE